MNSAVHAIIVPTQSVGMEEAMTTLDKRIPYYPVLMVLTQPPVITDIPLAKGYSFHPYEPSYKDTCAGPDIICFDYLGHQKHIQSTTLSCVQPCAFAYKQYHGLIHIKKNIQK